MLAAGGRSIMNASLKDVIERLHAANMADGGLDAVKLVSNLIDAFEEIDRRMTELERRAGIEPPYPFG
jgi:hypothetical protein